MRKPENLIGSKFGRLLVIKIGIKRTGNRVHWSCKCDCGEIIDINAKNLKNGNTKSCGCFRKESTARNKPGLKHGMKYFPEYSIWSNMKQRCYNKNDASYYRYGSRGITVCDRWLNSFENFYKDLGPRPSDLHSIDRIDNDGNYEPNNCQWATEEEQIINKSTSKIKGLEEANQIREMYKTGEFTHKELAEFFECSRQHRQ